MGESFAGCLRRHDGILAGEGGETERFQHEWQRGGGRGLHWTPPAVARHASYTVKSGGVSTQAGTAIRSGCTTAFTWAESRRVPRSRRSSSAVSTAYSLVRATMLSILT